jgi:hypothetical protein
MDTRAVRSCRNNPECNLTMNRGVPRSTPTREKHSSAAAKGWCAARIDHAPPTPSPGRSGRAVPGSGRNVPGRPWPPARVARSRRRPPRRTGPGGRTTRTPWSPWRPSPAFWHARSGRDRSGRVPRDWLWCRPRPPRTAPRRRSRGGGGSGPPQDAWHPAATVSSRRACRQAGNGAPTGDSPVRWTPGLFDLAGTTLSAT